MTAAFTPIMDGENIPSIAVATFTLRDLETIVGEAVGVTIRIPGMQGIRYLPVARADNPEKYRQAKIDRSTTSNGVYASAAYRAWQVWTPPLRPSDGVPVWYSLSAVGVEAIRGAHGAGYDHALADLSEWAVPFVIDQVDLFASEVETVLFAGVPETTVDVQVFTGDRYTPVRCYPGMPGLLRRSGRSLA